MTCYSFHDLTLEVKQRGPRTTRGLEQLLHDLSWVKTGVPAKRPSLCLDLRLNDNRPSLPRAAQAVFESAGIHGLTLADDFYLTEGTSLFHLRPATRQGRVHLAPAFFDQPPLLQHNFWGFGLIKLLRPLGLFLLHSAALVTPEDEGLLIAGESGSGKSTLTMGLIRQGWRYLTDDAVLLRRRLEGVDALALRKHLWVDAGKSAGDLPLGETIETAAGFKRRIRIEEVAPNQRANRCLPRILLFPRIVSSPESDLRPLDRVTALRHLLEQSGPRLFDRVTMPEHLKLLAELARQAALYELRAGRDLYQHPEKVIDLLTKARC